MREEEGILNYERGGGNTEIREGEGILKYERGREY